eukprot:SAG22_NODE_1180_length_5238_cov_2.463125_7_plen_63_part_00
MAAEDGPDLVGEFKQIVADLQAAGDAGGVQFPFMVRQRSSLFHCLSLPFHCVCLPFLAIQLC